MKILSIDGGGVFGIIPSYFLSLVDISSFDVIAGTSVGSILSMGYADGMSTELMHKKFVDSMHLIFSEKNYIFFKKPLFKDHHLNKLLQEFFTGKISELKKKIIISTFNTVDFKPKIYDNITEQDLREEKWEVVRKSCAAPSFFLPCKGYIDGGVVANNPSLVAISAVVNKMNIPYEEIEIMSLGTGVRNNSFLDNNIEKFFRWQWISPMLEMVTKSNEVITDFVIKQTKIKKYTRINIVPLYYKWNFVEPNIMEKCLELTVRYKDCFLKEYQSFF